MDKLAIPQNDLSISQLAGVFCQSGFFQDTKGEAQAITKILAGQENGFGPFASMSGIHIIKGKVEMSADMQATAIKQSGKYNFRVKEMTSQKCEVEFFEKSEFTNGKWASIGASSFSMEDAKSAGLASSDTWKKYPRNMLYARAITNGVAWFCPDVFQSRIYSEGEISGFSPETSPRHVEQDIQEGIDNGWTLEQDPPNPELEKLYQEIDKFFDEHNYHHRHRTASLKKHLGIESLRECRDVEKLKKYLKEGREKLQKKTEKVEEKTDPEAWEQEQIESNRHRVKDFYGDESDELKRYNEAVESGQWQVAFDLVTPTTA